jgi:hypothetical protein
MRFQANRVPNMLRRLPGRLPFSSSEAFDVRFDVAHWKDRRTPNICGLMSVFCGISGLSLVGPKVDL